MDKYTVINFRTATGKKSLKLRIPEKIQENQEEKKEIKKGYIGQSSFVVPQQIQQKEEESSEEMESVKVLKSHAIALPIIEIEKPEELLDTYDLKTIVVKYPLYPSSPKQGERVFAYAHIYFDNVANELVYHIVEPALSEADRKVLEDIKEFIEEKLDVNFGQIRNAEVANYITGIFDRAVKYFRIKSDTEVLKYYVIRDFIGLEMIEPLMRDKNIEDISCDGVDIPIYVYHRDPRFGSLRTNIMFTNRDLLDSFANKLSERTGKVISVARPLLDGTLPDGSRVQATLGSDIARHGSNFTIRMFTENPITPVDMLKFGTCDTRLLAYLWFLIEHESSILVSGGTASGKTSLLNVLSLFIKPQMKIVSIEDTAELRLPHPHWVPEVARTPIAEEGKVDMFELLRESLRQRPDYIIVGEVRGREAYVLFQQMAVGHAGLSTIHADTFPKLMDRLTTQPINLPVSLLQNLDMVLFVKRVKQGKRYNRRVASVIEILGHDQKINMPITLEVFRWDPLKDTFNLVNKSAILRKIINSTGMSEEDVQKEIINRSNVLKWMYKNKVEDYRKISSMINLYYLAPDFLLNKIEGGL
ncbi:MAG: type II/IV secretion system ATPase subunit [Candidatus Aenigmarchaeota archaeon]|nr:type II/IV secretion system ATPase subunit [Candidatus Aenigmarchaeota archaeon]